MFDLVDRITISRLHLWSADLQDIRSADQIKFVWCFSFLNQRTSEDEIKFVWYLLFNLKDETKIPFGNITLCFEFALYSTTKVCRKLLLITQTTLPSELVLAVVLFFAVFVIAENA